VISASALPREVIVQWHPAEPPPDSSLIDEQVVMVLTFINGVMMSFVQGYPVVTDAAHLDRRIQEMLRSITADRGPSTGAD
jgi:hypothetical protein